MLRFATGGWLDLAGRDFHPLNAAPFQGAPVPVYQKFVGQAVHLDSRYISMIMPSRWYSGGRNLDKFREDMLKDTHIRLLYDFANSDVCFPGVDISGGICYFLRDNVHDGPCTVTNVERVGRHSMNRFLDSHSVLIRSNNAIGVVEKVIKASEISLENTVSTQRPFGLRTYARPDDSGDLTLRWNGGKGPIRSERVTSGTDLIAKWKVIVSRVFFEHGGKTDKNGQNRVLSILEILAPNEVCSETYVVVNSFNSEQDAENFRDYLRTKFVRFLILQASSSIMITRSSFCFVPAQDFSRPWTDTELYAKYGLSGEEIAFVESMIRPME